MCVINDVREESSNTLQTLFPHAHQNDDGVATDNTEIFTNANEISRKRRIKCANNHMCLSLAKIVVAGKGLIVRIARMSLTCLTTTLLILLKEAIKMNATVQTCKINEVRKKLSF